MPKYYCDYCDTYLTHDSPSVRKTHNQGRKHKESVKLYYMNWLEQEAQNMIDVGGVFKVGMRPGLLPPIMPPPGMMPPPMPGMAMPPPGMLPPGAMMAGPRPMMAPPSMMGPMPVPPQGAMQPGPAQPPPQGGGGGGGGPPQQQQPLLSQAPQ